MTVITLLTDYGLKDSYVAEMKGVILGIVPDVTIIDISHDVGNYDIEEGAFHLARSVPYFSEGTIHIGVVDPGVGGERSPIVIKSRGAFFVGPDNGLLAPAAERLGIEKIYSINNNKLLPKRVSDVFDGRDVFGPTGALLAKGIAPLKFGPETAEYMRLPSYEANVIGSSIEARVIHIDGFGNLVMNITSEILEEIGAKEKSAFKVKIRGREYKVPYVRHFSAVPKEELLMLIAGGGYLELSVNMGNAFKRLFVERGEKLELVFLK